MGERLRAGVVGMGQMGRHHARVLAALEGVELVGVADPQVKDTGPTRLLRSVDELLAIGLDMCVVAVPTADHEAVATTLAAAGVHTMVEKPLAGSVDSCARIAQSFGEADLVGCVGHIERYNPSLQALRARLGQGELGEIYQVTTRRQGPFPDRVADIGVIMDLATHDVDSTAWVTQQQYAELSARTSHKSGRGHEDLVAAVGRLSDQTVVNHLVNWLSPMKERVMVVMGERGCYVADTLTADLTFHANGVVPVEWEAMASFRGVVQGDTIRYAIAKAEPLQTELAAFRDAVLGIRVDIVSMREATAVVSVAEALLTSATDGQTAKPALPK